MLSMVIIGNLGKDAEVKEINGQKCLNFNVAHTHVFHNQQGQKVESTTWVRCEYWMQKDTLSKYLVKGIKVYVEGIPRVYAYQNDQRQIVGSLQMRVNRLELLSSVKREESSNVTPQEAASLSAAANNEIPNFTPAAASSIGGPVDDLPF